MLSDDRIAEMMRDTWGCASIAPRHAEAFARAIEAKARRDALTEAERICDHYATALDGGANEYTRSRECMQAANAIRALKEGKPSGAGEPVATIKSWTNGSYCRNYKVEWYRNDLPEGTQLYTTQQPTQPQAGAVPLTPEQIKAMDRRHPAEDLCGWSYRLGIADAEAHHGIKGGQHGAVLQLRATVFSR